MPTQIIYDIETGVISEKEMTQEEIDAIEATQAASEALIAEQQAIRAAYNAKKADVQQLEDAALAVQISDAELAALPPVLQKIYRILRWLREKRALEMMDHGDLPFDVT